MTSFDLIDFQAWFVWCAALLGIVYTITQSMLLRPVRILLGPLLPPTLHYGLYCARCVGFWVALVDRFTLRVWPAEGVDPITSGFAAVGVLWFLDFVLTTTPVFEAEVLGVETTSEATHGHGHE